MARRQLSCRLDELSELLGQMCTEAARALRGGTAALVDGHVRLAEKILSGDAMPRLSAAVEQVVTETLVLHAPVAGDLRAVVAAIHSADDLSRMGVLARHVAEAARRRPPRSLPAEVRPVFTEMSRIGVGMALKVAEVVRTRNVLLAAELDGDDELMDTLHARMFEVLFDQSWPHNVAAAVDITLLARYYERFADHAVLVAGETVVAVTGRPPRDLPNLLRVAIKAEDESSRQ